IGGAADQRFDAIFERMLATCEELEGGLRQALADSRAELAVINGVVIGGLSVVFLGVAWVLVASQRALARLNERLEDRVAERTHDLRHSMDLAEQASRAKSEFLATMSHEIRTPMNAVIGMTSVLADTELSAEQREWLSTIQTSGEALLAIIDDVLDYSKIEAGRLDLEHAPFGLRECVEEALELVAAGAAGKPLELVAQIEPEAEGRFTGDVTRLRQIVVNLLSNAVKFTLRGEVVVRVGAAERPDGRSLVTIEVRDTGIGIPEDRMAHLFESFSQVDASTTRRYGGTGLGLAIVKRLCELMSGTVAVESTLGEGSVFTATMVVERGELRRTPPEGRALPPRTVLLVDDNATSRDTLTTTLRGWGLTAVVAGSAEAALRLADARGPFDLALLDAHMGATTGWQLAKALRERDDGGALPIVMLGPPAEAPSGASTALGIAAVLGKPVRRSRLYGALRAVLGEASERDASGERDASRERDEPGEPGEQGEPGEPGEPDEPDEFGEPGEPEQPSEPGEPGEPGESTESTESAGRAASAGARGPAARSAGQPTTPAQPLRILVAEDNPINQAVARAMLRKLGHQADVVSNGHEVLEALERERYDVVLMDIQMPEMDGLETTGRVVARWPSHQRPRIVAMTADAHDKSRERCVAAGMDDFVTKPVALAQLAQVLRRCADARRRAEPRDGSERG
ncbi:MAG: response regulator, partial [Myxococcales bacterium]|nr:response regulator [Myxococcales bacterium]